MSQPDYPPQQPYTPPDLFAAPAVPFGAYPGYQIPPPRPPRPANVVVSAVISFLYAAWLAIGVLVLFAAIGQASDDTSSGMLAGDQLTRAKTLLTVLAVFNILLIVGYVLAGVWTLTRTRLVLYVATGLSTILSIYWFARFNTGDLFVVETVYLLVPYVAVILAVLPNAGPFYASRR
jgi:hypothetical protein